MRQGLLRRWLRAFNPARRRDDRVMRLRHFDAARPSRATHGWPAPSSSVNLDLYAALPILRDRSRDLARNNPHAAKAIAALVGNAIGAGIEPRPKTGDDKLDGEVARLWAAFAREIDADGRVGFNGLLALAARAMFESGEVFLRRRPRRLDDPGSSPGQAPLAVPLQYQLLEADLLDHRENRRLPDGEVRLGIEFDRLGRRRRYWMHREHPGERVGMSQPRNDLVAVEADSILHVYEMQRPGQLRGIPWLAPVMLKLRELDDYEEAELVRKRLEACVAAIVFGADEESEESITPLVRDAAGNTVEQFEPGLIAYARGGKDVKFTQPSVSPDYGAYKRSQLMSIAAGARLTYELLAADLSQANFASMRGGWLEFRRTIEALRWTVFVPMMCEPIWRSFIDFAVTAGKLPARTPYAVEWTAPRFEAIDPLKEIMAITAAVRGGLMSLREAIASLGYDPDDVLREIAATNALLDALNIVLDSDPRRVTQSGALQAAIEKMLADDDGPSKPRANGRLPKEMP